MLCLREQEQSLSTLLRHPLKLVRLSVLVRLAFFVFFVINSAFFSMISTVASGVLMFTPFTFGVIVY